MAGSKCATLSSDEAEAAEAGDCAGGGVSVGDVGPRPMVAGRAGLLGEPEDPGEI